MSDNPEALPPDTVASIIQKAWDEKGPDVMLFGLAVAHRITAAIAQQAATPTKTKAERVRKLVNEGPFPGMSEAFDAHMGADLWTDRSYAPDASLWASAWKAALARQAATPPAPLTDSYVQPVPDKCDRIVWRNAYYHLPLQAATPAPAEPVARIRIGYSALGPRASFFTLTDAGRALPTGAYDLYAAPPAAPAAQP